MSIVDGYIQSLHSALGQRESVVAHSAGSSREATPLAALPPADDRTLARQLAAALDRAIDLDQWELANRIARQSIRISHEQPLLAERIARLRAARGEFETALSIIDSCRDSTASMRLLRAVCLLHAGRMHEAHADLIHWTSKASAPLQARLMLAILEWRSGGIDDAVAALQRNLQQIEDPTTLAALMLMTAGESRTHMAGVWAERLRAACATHPNPLRFEAMLIAAGQGRSPRTLTATPHAVAALATELVAVEHLLPALVEAQHLAGEAETARLLAEAIERALDDFDDRAAALACLADLHETLGERDIAAARREQARLASHRDDVIASIDRRGVKRSNAPTAGQWKELAA